MAPNPNPGEEPKLIIDTDWKAQAQAEKEKLAQTVKPAAKPVAPGSPNPTPGAAARPAGQGQPDADPDPNEPASFDELIRMLAMQALTFLGEIPDPQSGQRMFAPEYARRFIDMINILEEKTKGNLSKEEDEGLKGVAADLRMAYVEIGKAVAKAVAEGKIKPQAMGGRGPGSPGIEIAQPGRSPLM
jgi:hypothetical protein